MYMKKEEVTLESFLFQFIEEEKEKYQAIQEKVIEPKEENVKCPFSQKELTALEKTSASVREELTEYEEELTEFVKTSPSELPFEEEGKKLFDHVYGIERKKEAVEEFLDLQKNDYFTGERKKEEKKKIFFDLEKSQKDQKKKLKEMEEVSAKLQKLVSQRIAYQEKTKWNFKKQQKELMLAFLLFMTSKRWRRDPSFGNTVLLSSLLVEQLKAMSEPFYTKQRIAFYEDYQKELENATKEMTSFGRILDQNVKQIEAEGKDLEKNVKPFCSKEEWEELYAFFMTIQAELKQSQEEFLETQKTLDDSLQENKAKVKQKERYNYENGMIN